MLNLMAEVIAISWLGNTLRQEDALLIEGKISQSSKSRITKVYHPTQMLCVAVADGLRHSPASDRASKAVLQSVLRQHQAGKRVWLSTVQTDLCQALADDPNSYGASTTLALVEAAASNHSNKQLLCVTHVGDSRVYHYQKKSGWRQLTEDHTTLAAMSHDHHIVLDQKVEYASMYSALNHCLVADWADNNVDGLCGQLVDVQAGDWILLCSDGLYDIVGHQCWPEIAEETDLADWLKQVHDAVHRKDAYDNGSVVLIRWS